MASSTSLLNLLNKLSPGIIVLASGSRAGFFSLSLLLCLPIEVLSGKIGKDNLACCSKILSLVYYKYCFVVSCCVQCPLSIILIIVQQVPRNCVGGSFGGRYTRPPVVGRARFYAMPAKNGAGMPSYRASHRVKKFPCALSCCVWQLAVQRKQK